MPFAASYSRVPDLSFAAQTVCDELRSALDGASPDLAFVFVSPAHAERLSELPGLIGERLSPQVLLGCTGETVVGGGEEVESGPVLSVWAASLPGATVEPFHVEFTQTPDGIASSGLPSASSGAEDPPRAVFVLGEPFSSVPNTILNHMADEFPGVPVLGGMASGGAEPGENRLFRGTDCLEYGAVGAVVYGGPRIRAIVSQGCRPIDRHYVVTRADENLVYELGGEPVMERLQEILPNLSERDQQLARQGLHLGIAMSEYQDQFERGDFLIANVIGADPDQGAIAIGNRVRVGQTVQFHVRDADTADEELLELLKRDRETHESAPQAGLLFSCNGRGTRLFSEPNHDAATIQQHAGPLPLAGFFAQGELGPVGGKNYIHGFTASVALFE